MMETVTAGSMTQHTHRQRPEDLPPVGLMLKGCMFLHGTVFSQQWSLTPIRQSFFVPTGSWDGAGWYLLRLG